MKKKIIIFSIIGVILIIGGILLRQYLDIEADRKYKAEFKYNLPKYLEIEDNYKYRNIGGISDLKVTFYNNTPFTVYEAIITVDYIKTSGDIYKSQDILIDFIGANRIKEFDAPDSDRGTKVKCFVKEITIGELNLMNTTIGREEWKKYNKY